MKIIWTKEELKKIKHFILKFNLKLNDNNELIKGNRNNQFAPMQSSFHKETEDLATLLFLNDRNEIQKILNLSTEIKKYVEENKDDPRTYGFVSNISKINPEDHTEIFTIFSEILSLYKRIINRFSIIITKDITDPDIILQQIENIKNSKTETQEETKIKEIITQNLKLINGIADTDIFKPMIEKYNQNIKNILAIELNRRLAKLNKDLEYQKIHDASNYIGEFIVKKRAEKRSYGNGKYNMD